MPVSNVESSDTSLQRLDSKPTSQPQEMTRKNRWYHEVSTTDIITAALAIIGLLATAVGSGLLIGGGLTNSAPLALTGAGLVIVGSLLMLVILDSQNEDALWLF